MPSVRSLPQMKIPFIPKLTLIAGLFAASSNVASTEQVVIMGSDTLGAKLTVRLAEAFRSKMEARGVPSHSKFPRKAQQPHLPR